MPKLCKAMRAAVAKQADDGFICYVIYVLYVGYVAAHRCLAECSPGPCGALRRRCSRRTFPVMAVKAVLVDARTSRGCRRSVRLGYVSYVLYVSYAALPASNRAAG